MTLPAHYVYVSIHRPVEDVYRFASNPENLPKWAAGLSGSIKKVAGFWVSESPMGVVKIKFVEKNQFGVLDHDVTLPNGIIMHNPMRVFKNADGSELVFTLYRQQGVTDDEFNKDIEMITTDLRKIKSLIERQ